MRSAREGLRLVSAARVVALVTVLGLVLSACAPAPAPAKPTEAPKPAAPAPAPVAAPAAAPAAALAAAPAASPAAAAKPSGPAPDTIKVGAVVPLTGRYASLGEQVKNGYELAVEDLNKDGGVTVKEFGKKIRLELKMLDDESDPTKTVQRLETLASENVVAYLGGAGSDLHAAAAGVAEKNKTPYLGIAFALYQVHQKGFKYLFSPFPKSPGLAKGAFDLADSLSPKPLKVAIFAEKTDWGAEMRELWKKEAADRKYEIVADEEYAVGSKDFAPMILKAKSGNADLMLSLPTPPDGIAIMKQMKELDFNPKLAVAIRAPDGTVWAQNLARDGDFVLNMPGWSNDLKFPGVSDLRTKHQAKYNKPPEALVGPAYACLQVLSDALGRAEKADRDGIRDAVAAANLAASVIGPIKFNADGTGQVVTVINQTVDGKQGSVWPKDQAGATIVYPAKAFKER